MSKHNYGNTTKDKIIKATLGIIADEGFLNVTIRKIAAMAEVNVAAVNYHFGSKDSVINEALKTVTIQLEDAFSCLKASEVDPQIRLGSFVKQYSKVVREYPDIIRHFISQSLNNNPIKVEYQKYLKEEGLELISSTIGQMRPGEDQSSLYMRTLQLISSLSFPILIGDQIKENTGIDLYNPETSNLYTELLMENIVRPKA